jgi:hypothetical protein
MMKFLSVLVAVSAFSGAANADQIPLICNGNITLEGHGTTAIDNETSVVDYEKETLKPPLYAPFPDIKNR